jgi:hypothetical protein
MGVIKTLQVALIMEDNDEGSERSVRVKSMGSYSEPSLVLT